MDWSEVKLQSAQLQRTKFCSWHRIFTRNEGWQQEELTSEEGDERTIRKVLFYVVSWYKSKSEKKERILSAHSCAPQCQLYQWKKEWTKERKNERTGEGKERGKESGSKKEELVLTPMNPLPNHFDFLSPFSCLSVPWRIEKKTTNNSFPNFGGNLCIRTFDSKGGRESWKERGRTESFFGETHKKRVKGPKSSWNNLNSTGRRDGEGEEGCLISNPVLFSFFSPPFYCSGKVFRLKNPSERKERKSRKAGQELKESNIRTFEREDSVVRPTNEWWSWFRDINDCRTNERKCSVLFCSIPFFRPQITFFFFFFLSPFSIYCIGLWIETGREKVVCVQITNFWTFASKKKEKNISRNKISVAASASEQIEQMRREGRRTVVRSKNVLSWIFYPSGKNTTSFEDFLPLCPHFVLDHYVNLRKERERKKTSSASHFQNISERTL